MINKISLFLYGEPGAGKTHQINLLKDCEQFKKILVVDFDRRAHAALSSPKFILEEPKSIADIEKIAQDLLKKDGKYADVDAVVIDTFTEMVSISLDEVALKSVEDTSRRTDQDRLEQKDYGINTKRITRICRLLRNNNKSLILTGHAKEVYPKDRNGVPDKNLPPTSYIVRLPGEMCTIVLSFMDMVAFLAVKSKTHKLVLRNIDAVYTRTSGNLGSTLADVVDEPNLGKVVQQIFDDHK